LEEAACITTLEVSGRKGKHFIVKSAAPAQPGARWGTAVDERGQDINPRQHAYVVVPTPRGFYVLIYPATREGYPKYEKRFIQLVNSFTVLTDGPAGPPLERPKS
jgi:RecA-family ATPase